MAELDDKTVEILLTAHGVSLPALWAWLKVAEDEVELWSGQFNFYVTERGIVGNHFKMFSSIK